MAPNSPTPWTEDVLTKLRELVAEGQTSGQIAKVLGFTRNAVIGRCHRDKLQLGGGRPAYLAAAKAKPIPVGFMGRSRHDSETQTRKAAKSATLSKGVTLAPLSPGNVVVLRPAPALFVVDREPAAPGPVGGVALMDLRERHCRWPLDNGKAASTHFCGADKERGSYCASHAQLAYTGTDAERRNEYRRQQRAIRLEAAE